MRTRTRNEMMQDWASKTPEQRAAWTSVRHRTMPQCFDDDLRYGQAKDAKMKIYRELNRVFPSLNLLTLHLTSHSWTTKNKPSWLVYAVESLYLDRTATGSVPPVYVFMPGKGENVASERHHKAKGAHTVKIPHGPYSVVYGL
jgi:hypothetical protein